MLAGHMLTIVFTNADGTRWSYAASLYDAGLGNAYVPATAAVAVIGETLYLVHALDSNLPDSAFPYRYEDAQTRCFVLATYVGNN